MHYLLLSLYTAAHNSFSSFISTSFNATVRPTPTYYTPVLLVGHYLWPFSCIENIYCGIRYITSGHDSTSFSLRHFESYIMSQWDWLDLEIISNALTALSFFHTLNYHQDDQELENHQKPVKMKINVSCSCNLAFFFFFLCIFFLSLFSPHSWRNKLIMRN